MTSGAAPQPAVAKVAAATAPSRQQLRLQCRQATWSIWRCYANRVPIGPIDDKGIMPRRTRRSIARALAKRQFATLAPNVEAKLS